MSESRPILIEPLAGLNQRWTSRAPEASVAQDLWFDPRGGWQSAGGYKRIIRGPANEQTGVITNPFASVGSIESIHFFSQHNGSRRWLIYIDGTGQLIVFNPSTAARTGSAGDFAYDRANNQIVRSVVYTPWQRSQSACWGDTFYMVNGIDQPLAFDGYCWDYAGWSGPAGVIQAVAMSKPHSSDSGYSPSVVLPNIGIGPIDTATTDAANYKVARRYKVCYVNNRGARSPWSAASEIVYFVNVGGDNSITRAPHFARLNLPIGPSSAVARVIACTQNLYDSSNTLITGRDVEFFEHSIIRDNCTALIQDGLDDGYLGPAIDESQFGPWPVNAKFIVPFKGRMYATGAGNSSVYYSKRGNPEEWPIDNVLDVGDAHLGPTTAIYATRNALIVSKAHGIYLIKDDGVNEPVAETLTRESGWSAPNSIREVPGVGLCGLSDDGITILQGTLQNEGVETKTLNAGVDLPDVFRTVNASAILNACSAVYHRDKEWWIALPSDGHADCVDVLVYHYEIRQWSTRPNYPISSMLETTDGNLLFSSYAGSTDRSPDGKTHLGIMVYSRGCQYKDDYAAVPTAIEPIYETGQISIASAYRSFRPKHVLIRGILHGNNDLTVNVYTNRSLQAWLTTPYTQDQQYPQNVVPVYGSAVFDSTDTWQNWRPGVMRYDLENPIGAPQFEATIRITPAAGTRYMTLLNLSLEVSPNDPINAKPLRPDS